MKREALIEQITSLIAEKKLDRPLLVGIDGIDCAGKTMLGEELQPELETRGFDVIRASIDGFHRPRRERYQNGELSGEGYYQCSFDYDSLRRHLLDPLSSGSKDAICRLACFDYRTDSAVEGEARPVTANTILIFDGVFLFRTEINHYWDFRVFVKISFDESVARAVNRDVPLFESQETVRLRYKCRYIGGQEIYLREVKPETLADVIICNHDPLNPEITLYS